MRKCNNTLHGNRINLRGSCRETPDVLRSLSLSRSLVVFAGSREQGDVATVRYRSQLTIAFVLSRYTCLPALLATTHRVDTLTTVKISVELTLSVLPTANHWYFYFFSSLLWWLTFYSFSFCIIIICLFISNILSILTITSALIVIQRYVIERNQPETEKKDTH